MSRQRRKHLEDKIEAASLVPYDGTDYFAAGEARWGCAALNLPDDLAPRASLSCVATIK